MARGKKGKGQAQPPARGTAGKPTSKGGPHGKACGRGDCNKKGGK